MPSTPLFQRDRLFVLAEISLIFIVFFLYGAWPVPDVNEAHYLSKTIHWWSPGWGEHDFFLNSNDTHYFFYVGFGWLTRWLSPFALAWTGRVITWWLLAWSWRRLNWAVLGRQWWSIATAAVMLFLSTHFEMAGEWIVGGVEAKGFAYALVLLGLEALVRDRWNRAWLFFGAASLLHVLVGGWSAVAAGVGWLIAGRGNRPTLRSMWPGLIGGFLISLPSLLTSVMLTRGVDPRIVDQANRIYVFDRLDHHLYPVGLPVLPFAILLFAWLVVRWQTPKGHALWRLHGFVAGAVAICMTGFAIAYVTMGHLDLAAALLRFYWFRLTDIMVPVGVAVGMPVMIEHIKITRPSIARACTIGLMLLAGWQIGSNTLEQAAGRPFRGIRKPMKNHLDDWHDACHWIVTSGSIPQDATFLTPRLCRTFKWYTGRCEVVNRKDIPQDAPSIVEWWQRQQIVHATRSNDPHDKWFDSLANQGELRLLALGQHYGAEYVLTVTQPRLNLPIEYENETFVIYRLPHLPSPEDE